MNPITLVEKSESLSINLSNTKQKTLSNSDRIGSAERISINALISQSQETELEEPSPWAYRPTQVSNFLTLANAALQVGGSPPRINSMKEEVKETSNLEEHPSPDVILMDLSNSSPPTSLLPQLVPSPVNPYAPKVNTNAVPHIQNFLSPRYLEKTLRKSSSFPLDTHQYLGSPRGFKCFALMEEPNEVQRKAYAKENRCIQPNPLVITLKDESIRSSLVEAIVNVKLANFDGGALPPGKEYLQSLDNTFTKSFDKNFNAYFTLKMMNTAEGDAFRLLFSVKYKIKGAEATFDDKVISRVFVVYSNKHNMRHKKQKP